MKRSLAFLSVFILAGCGGILGGKHEAPFTYTNIPGVPKPVNDLGYLIAQQQRNVVTPGGNEANPGYSDVDKQNFDNSGRLQQIVANVSGSSTFQSGVAAIKPLSADTQTLIWQTYMQPIDQTWAQTGVIGDGTTDAGQEVEIEISNGLTQAVQNAVAAAAGSRSHPAPSSTPSVSRAPAMGP